MNSNLSNLISKALQHYGNRRYLDIIDRLSLGYKGDSLGERNSEMLEDYVRFNDYTSFLEAVEANKPKS